MNSIELIIKNKTTTQDISLKNPTQKLSHLEEQGWVVGRFRMVGNKKSNIKSKLYKQPIL